MQPRTEEFLYLLLWSTEKLTRPTFRNVTDSFEAWAYRNNLLRQLATLEKERLLERNQETPDERVYRLTQRGRLRALGGRDPEMQWSRDWDRKWRLVLFDVPTAQNTYRDRLRRFLRDNRFGYLQNSVWITPDPLEDERNFLAGGKIDVESIVLLEARPCAGESQAQIVAGAWDFELINRRYARHLKTLAQCPTDPLRTRAAAAALQRWAAEERTAWLAAVVIDPLLPECLLPAEYLGCHAWRQRKEALRKAGRQLSSFHL